MKARCDECGSRLAVDQRYCVECGARRGPLPASMQRLIASALDASRSSAAAEIVAPPEPEPVPEPVPVEEPAAPAWLPGPKAIAVAIMSILAFGVILGSLLNPIAQSVAGQPVIVAMNPTPAPAAPVAAPATSDNSSSNDSTAAPQQTVTETVQSVTPPPGT